MKYLLLLLCLCLSINGIAQNDRGLDTNAIEAPSTNKPSLEREFRVLKIEEKAKDVFFVYVTRNDTAYTIASHYDGTIIPGSILLTQGSRFKAQLRSFFFNYVAGIEFTTDYYGVRISSLDNVYSCTSLNGVFYYPQKDEEPKEGSLQDKLRNLIP